jgi:hypothetical protein
MDQSDSAPTDQFVTSEKSTPAPNSSNPFSNFYDSMLQTDSAPTNQFVASEISTPAAPRASNLSSTRPTERFVYRAPVEKNVKIETFAKQTPEIYPPAFYNTTFPEKIYIVRQGCLPFSSEKIYRFELYVNRILKTVFFSKHKDIEDAYAEFQIKQKIPDTTWENSIAHKDMMNCEDRFNTFKNWPRFSRTSPTKLAMAGFSYCNFSDRVRCFWCNLILKDWEPTDEAWSEHTRWSPNCPFIKLCRLDV